MIFALILGLGLMGPECPDNNCVQYVIAGDTVPFSGQLLSPHRAALLGVRAEATSQRVDLALREAEAICQVQIGSCANLRENDQKACNQRIDFMTGYAETPLLQHPIVVAVITAVITTIAYFGAFQAAKSLGN